jgi:hypothetical protein
MFRKRALLTDLCFLCILVCFCCRCSAISPAAVSAAMAQLSARWGGCRQEDAHEFLTALLEAVQTEVLAAQVRHRCCM